MSRAALVVAIVLAGVIPIWGCNPTPPLASNTSTLEARIVKLERDSRAVEAARDAALARAADFETRLKAESARAAAIQRERDDLATNLKSRVAQTEVVQTQLDGLKKGLKDLLGTMDTTALPANPAGVPYTLLPPR